MILWLVLAAMTALAAALIAWPLLRPPAAPSGRRDFELQVYRAQLEELARERERGLLGEREADAAKLEIERRMLAADAAPGRRSGDRSQGQGRRAAAWAIALLIALPLLALGLYGTSGRPDLPSVPFAGRADERRLAEAEAERQTPSVETMVARLEQRVAERADDLEAWRRLGQAYELAGRYDDAVRARRRALALDEGSAEANAALGEALVMANGGTVTPAASQAFERALALEPADPRARFYRGLGLLQEGDRQAALDAWVALIESSPGDAPWLPELQRRVAALGADLGVDPADLPSPSGPTREQMQAAEGMAPEDRTAMIREMVAGLEARLEEEPDDVEGWRMLGRSYGVLGELQKAAEAYRRVAEARPDDLEAQLDYADALLAATPPEQGLSPTAEQQMRRVLELDAQNPLALFYLGQAAAQAGDVAAARDHWQRLIAQVPASAPERAQIQRLLDQLPPG